MAFCSILFCHCLCSSLAWDNNIITEDDSRTWRGLWRRTWNNYDCSGELAAYSEMSGDVWNFSALFIGRIACCTLTGLYRKVRHKGQKCCTARDGNCSFTDLTCNLLWPSPLHCLIANCGMLLIQSILLLFYSEIYKKLIQKKIKSGIILFSSAFNPVFFESQEK